MNMSEQNNLITGELRVHEPMARHTSWRAGGCADRAYVPADLNDMRRFIASLPAHEPVYVVGLGSNLLVRDGGLRGTVVFTHGVLKGIALENGAITVEAGVPSPKLARFAALHGLAGAEFMAGIPGTVGGALAMNAGCYGSETWRIVESVTTLDRSGALHERRPHEYAIGYRTVVRKAENAVAQMNIDERTAALDEWFVAARLRLVKGDGAVSRATITQLLRRRIATQPLSMPNAGSVFRNPQGDHAARLIEACGLKGHRVGGAMISPKHANFIVNCGGASAADVESLLNTARDAVRQKFSIALEIEVRIVGDAARAAA